jgi:hypothetical protein
MAEIMEKIETLKDDGRRLIEYRFKPAGPVEPAPLNKGDHRA